MHLFGACLFKAPDGFGAGRAADDGIIHQNHPLAPQFTFHGAELNFHLIHPVILTGGDEGTPDILIFD